MEKSTEGNPIKDASFADWLLLMPEPSEEPGKTLPRTAIWGI